MESQRNYFLTAWTGLEVVKEHPHRHTKCSQVLVGAKTPTGSVQHNGSISAVMDF